MDLILLYKGRIKREVSLSLGTKNFISLLLFCLSITGFSWVVKAQNNTDSVGPYSFTTSDLIYESFVENSQRYQGPYSSYILPPFDPNRYVRSFLTQAGPYNPNFGVLGSFSNLGSFGLFGDSLLNPEQVFKALKNWEEYSIRMAELAGAASPFGPNSQLLAEMTMRQMAAWMPAMNTVDGPLAELGALFHQGVQSATGPNGFTGVWGFDIDQSGQFRDKHGFLIRQSRDLEVDGKNKQVQLYEIYDADQAMKLSEIPGFHDLHFGVRGQIKKMGSIFKIPVTPRNERWVSIMLLAKRPGDRFRLRVLDKNGDPVPGMVAGDKENMPPFIRLEVPKEREVMIEVEYFESSAQFFWTPWHIYLDSFFQFWSSKKYRPSKGQFGLYVSGAPLNAPVGGKEQFYLRHYEPEKYFPQQEAFSRNNNSCEYLFL